VTSTLVFEDDGKVGEYVGGYEDWIRQRKPTGTPSEKNSNKKKERHRQNKKRSKLSEKKKLGFNEKRELKSLPDKIGAMESQQKKLEQTIGQRDFYQQDKETISQTMASVKQLQEELQKAYERWEYLAGFEA